MKMRRLVPFTGKLLLFACLALLPASAADPARPVLSGSTVKTPSGQLIRMGVGWFSNWSGDANQMVRLKNQAYYQQLKDFGFNGIRITNWDMRRIAEGHITSTNYYQLAQNLVSDLDIVIDLAAANGMYLMITNSNPGSYNKAYLDAFWNVFAARYKNRTHVMYEVCNEPVSWTPAQYTTAVLNDLASVQWLMRSAAPNTPLFHLCFPHATSSMVAKVAEYTSITGINWSGGKDFVSFHPYGKTSSSPDRLTSQWIMELRASYPVMCTEVGFVGQPVTFPIQHGSTTYEDQTLFFEAVGISRLYFGSTSPVRKDTQVRAARSAGLYWQSAYRRRINDPLSNWNSTYARSANMTFATNNASAYFNGDASRATRSDTSAGWITYEAVDVYAFEAKIYSNGAVEGISFLSSPDGSTWTEVPHGRTASVATSGGWSYAFFRPLGQIAPGNRFLRVRMAGTSANWATQLSEISVWNRYDGWPNRSVDGLENWTKIASRTSNTQLVSSNPDYFAGDADRATRTNTSPGHWVYFEENAEAFRSRIFYNQQSDGIEFAASPDGVSWTTVPVSVSDVTATDGGWHHAIFTPSGALPFGTNYIRVRFSSTRGNWVTQLGDITIWSIAKP